jgi:methylmalonyl-CoA/ethylmalonyl-CoA epimerase
MWMQSSRWYGQLVTFDPVGAALPTALQGLTPTQICLLVPDLAAGVAAWSAVLGRSDWLVYTYNPDTVPELTFRGQPGKFAMRLALSGVGPQLELIQPLEGPSIYHEWVEQRGYGTHHFGFHVPNAEVVMNGLANEGLEAVQTGSGYGMDGDGAFAYYDLVDALGLYLEIIELPARRRPSETL